MDKFHFHHRAQECLANATEKEVTRLIKGHGAWAWDIDGKKYLDYCNGNILGYGNEGINSAIISRLTQGISLSHSSTAEVEAAEEIKKIVPFIDAVMFFRTPQAAINLAIDLARLKTRRHNILTQWDKCIKDAAAVLIRPILQDISTERVTFLHDVRRMCDENGTLLIFDESASAFRFPRFTAANYFGIIPDIICLGGAIGGGMPLNILGGKYSVMGLVEEGESEFQGEILALAAMKKMISLLSSAQYSLKELWEKGQKFLDDFNKIWPEKIKIVGYPTRGVFTGDPLINSIFFKEAKKSGVLFGYNWIFNFAVAENTYEVIQLSQDILTKIKHNKVTT